MGDKNKNFAIIGVSSILLVAAVVGTVTYGVSKKNGEDAVTSTSSKAAQTMCQYTDYKDTCEKSLSKSGDDNDPNHLAQVAFQAAIEGVRGVMANSTLLKDAGNDPMTKQAFEVCQKVLDDSIDDLEKSVEKIKAFDKSDFDLFVNDLTTWLSGAATYQETCLDAFENTTGDTGEKMKALMKTTSQLTSNGLAIVSQLNELLSSLQIPGFSRRLLEEEEGSGSERRVMYDDYYNTEHKRNLLEDKHHDGGKGGAAAPAGPLSTLKPNCIVAQDGSGQFKTIQAAVNTAPLKINQTFYILVKAGIYKETVNIPKKAYNIYMVGEGPTKTRITGSKNFADGTNTFNTATVAVDGDNFIAKDIGIENTAGAIKHQAVALRVTSDRSIFYNCHIDGYQDTLYAHSHRQYYRDCTISGTIDFIFGDAAAVFQNCKLVVRKPMANQACMVTAQGRKESRGKGATILQGCTITGEPEFMAAKPMPQAFLGRPWKEYSRTVVMQSFIDSIIVPEGWSEWAGTFALDTLSYAEYQNRGPGSNTAKRVHWKGIKTLSPQQAASFTPGPYIDGHVWIQGTGLPYEPSMMKV